MKKLLKFNTTFISILFLIFLSLTFADERADRVDKLFNQWDKVDTPGCALAVIKDGKIIYKRGYGMANLEHNIPISPKTVFYIGSVSKQFVAFSTAILAKQGKLSLDDDIRKYVPELPDYGTPVTIRHLLHHTSGLRDYLALLDIAGIDFGYFHEKDVLELITRQKELNFKSGEEYLYSNSGYFLLAVIVERASGKSLRKFAEENIFRPLGMKNSHFHDDYTEIIKDRASGYYPAGKGKYKNFISTFDCVGSGGLFTSVEGLFLWDQNFYHNKVGGKDLINFIHTRGTLNNGKKLNYAFALSIGIYKGLKTVGHGGALGGYRSAFIRFPEQNFSVICLSNLSTFNPTKLCQQVADIYLADQFKEERARTELKEAEKPKFIKLPKKKLKEKVGSYIDRRTGAVRRLFLKDGKLILEAFGQKFPLAPIKFEKQNEAKLSLMHVYQEGKKPVTYESVKLVALTPEQLKEYEGDFYSGELQVTFKLVLKEEKLYFVHRNAPKAPLQPTLQDRFAVRGFRIHFIRDEENKISGFNLNAGRVRNLRFNKKID